MGTFSDSTGGHTGGGGAAPFSQRGEVPTLGVLEGGVGRLCGCRTSTPRELSQAENEDLARRRRELFSKQARVLKAQVTGDRQL